VAPTGEHSIGCEEKEDEAPLNVELHQVESLGKIESEEGKNKQPKDQPRQEETSPPSPDSMTCQTVAHCRNGGKQRKEPPHQDHPVLVINLIGKSEGYKCQTSDEVADVKEEEASQ